MLRQIMAFLFLPLIALLLGVSCARPPAIADAKRELEGRWELAVGHDCRDFGIRSDNLVLHSDGRLEQHFVSIYNQRYDATSEQWSYSSDNHIDFNTRKSFFTKQPAEGVVGVSTRENLIVEFGKPTIILLNPDSDCFYRKVGGE